MPWDWDYIAFNPNINLKNIKENIDKPWNFYKLSYNQSVTIDILNNFINREWDWDSLSENKNLTIEFINENMDKPWNLSKLHRNKTNIIVNEYRKYLAHYQIQQWALSKIISPKYKIGRKMIEKKMEELYLIS